MPRQKREVPWLDRRGPTYYACWYDAAARRTRRCSLGTSDAGEAAGRFAAFLREGPSLYAGADKPPPAVGLTVACVLDDYLREHADDPAAGVADPVRLHDASDNLVAFFGSMSVSAIGIPTCRAYAEARRSGEVAKTYRDGKTVILAGDATIRRELNVLVAAINHAVRWRRLSPADVPPIEKPTVQTGLAPWLYPDELERLRHAAEGYGDAGRLRDFIDVAYYTAARAKSVARLTVFQVSLEAARINLSPPGDRLTGKRRGIVPIDDQLLPTIRRLVERSTDGHLFGARSALYRPFIKTAERAGLRTLVSREMRPAASCSPHILRHSRATHLLQAGVDVWSVASLLHDTVATVERTYAHACPGHVAAALRRGRETG